MSADQHVNDHAAHDEDEEGGVHATLGGYVTGFIVSVILTAIPFWLVMNKVIPSAGLTIVVILGFAAVQIVVHMVYFLHMTPKSENGWSMMALVFTIVLVVITLSGSLWVMYHLKTNMMPGTAEEVRRAP
jgi:cytochrome o ubiquinol oxidase operon protein cyoD